MENKQSTTWLAKVPVSWLFDKLIDSMIILFSKNCEKTLPKGSINRSRISNNSSLINSSSIGNLSSRLVIRLEDKFNFFNLLF